MKFNGSKKYATGEIPKSYLKVNFPDTPPKKVNHEHLGIGVFIKTHPFGHMGHIRKGARSHEYTFTRIEWKKICYLAQSFGCPSTQPRTSTTSHKHIGIEQCILTSAD